MPRLISRNKAGEAGLSRYYTGKPCAKGHLSERHVSTGGCIECVRKNLKTPKWRKHYAERQAERRRRWREIKQQKENSRSAVTANV